MNETQTNDACLRLENQLCFPLYACAKEVVRQYREPLQALNLTYTQYIVMMVLWEFGEMTEGEIGKKVHLDSGTLAPLLKRLQKVGYINRVRPEGNENKLILSLTPEGEQLKKMAIKVPTQMQGCIPLSEKDMILLRELLNRALVGMNIDRRETKWKLKQLNSEQTDFTHNHLSSAEKKAWRSSIKMYGIVGRCRIISLTQEMK